MPCSAVTSALLGALAAQAEFGDYDPSEHGEGLAYLDELEFCPDQTPELLEKIAQIHRTLRSVCLWFSLTGNIVHKTINTVHLSIHTWRPVTGAIRLKLPPWACK